MRRPGYLGSLEDFWGVRRLSRFGSGHHHNDWRKEEEKRRKEEAKRRQEMEEEAERRQEMMEHGVLVPQPKNVPVVAPASALIPTPPTPITTPVPAPVSTNAYQTPTVYQMPGMPGMPPPGAVVVPVPGRPVYQQRVPQKAIPRPPVKKSKITPQMARFGKIAAAIGAGLLFL